MKKLYRKLLPIVAVVLVFAACEQEHIEPVEVSECPTFSVSIDGSNTRAADDYWEKDDKIGVSGSDAINVCHVTQANADTLRVENPEQQFFFQDNDPVYFTAYYPYNSSLNPTTRLITISTSDQAVHKNFDFLWADGEGSKKSPLVEFKFTHRMSKVTFVFKNGQNMDVSAINKIRLNDLVVEGTFDTTTGVCGVDAATPTASTTMYLTDVQTEEPVTPLFLFPQTLTEPVKLEIYAGGSQYFVCNLTIPDNELQAGTNYTYTITVNKTGLQVTGATISDWIEEKHVVDASSGDNPG